MDITLLAKALYRVIQWIEARDTVALFTEEEMSQIKMIIGKYYDLLDDIDERDRNVSKINKKILD